MNHKQRQLAAIRHQRPDRIYVDAQAIENADAIGEVLGIPSAEIVNYLDLERVNVGLEYAGDVGLAQDGEPRTEWGTSRYHERGTRHVYPLQHLDSVSEIDHYKWPDPGGYDYAAARENTARSSRDYAVRGPRFSVITEPVFPLLGIEEALVKMLLSPKSFEAVIDNVF
jgi:hypothetical protein